MLLQPPAIELAAGVARQQNQRTAQKQRQRVLTARAAQLHGCAAQQQTEDKRHRLVVPPARPCRTAEEAVDHLRQKQRKDEPRAKVPSEVLAVDDGRQQQRVRAQRRADLKAAEAAKQRRAHAVDHVKDIQRHEQPSGPRGEVGEHAAVEPEEIPGAEGKEHQMEGIIPEQAAHGEHVVQRRVSVHDQHDGNQVQRTENHVFSLAGRVMICHDSPRQRKKQRVPCIPCSMHHRPFLAPVNTSVTGNNPEKASDCLKFSEEKTSEK